MRKFFWLALLVGGYFWVVSTGNEELVVDRAKFLYRTVTRWFEDAEVDFHMKPPKKVSPKKQDRSRRWEFHS
ncbi:MAG: hypothetical protein FJZ64_03495 [Chlamydiae bacterium]|nr:hypothetical protein [Chlamydiota bacterium]